MTSSEKAAHCLGDVLEDLVMGHGRRAFPLRGRAAAADAVEPVPVSSKADIPNARNAK